jgi:hypothetical protein
MCPTGLRAKCLPHPPRRVGHERLQGSRGAILGSQHRRRPDDAPRPQELRHLRRTLSDRRPLRHRQWRHESEDLELRSLSRATMIGSPGLSLCLRVCALPPMKKDGAGEVVPLGSPPPFFFFFFFFFGHAASSCHRCRSGSRHGA